MKPLRIVFRISKVYNLNSREDYNMKNKCLKGFMSSLALVSLIVFGSVGTKAEDTTTQTPKICEVDEKGNVTNAPCMLLDAKTREFSWFPG